eukprot:4131858-Ditylum_brightwellii.AAC.1
MRRVKGRSALSISSGARQENIQEGAMWHNFHQLYNSKKARNKACPDKKIDVSEVLINRLDIQSSLHLIAS